MSASGKLQTDEQGVIVSVNARALELLSVAKHEIIGKNIDMILHGGLGSDEGERESAIEGFSRMYIVMFGGEILPVDVSKNRGEGGWEWEVLKPKLSVSMIGSGMMMLVGEEEEDNAGGAGAGGGGSAASVKPLGKSKQHPGSLSRRSIGGSALNSSADMGAQGLHRAIRKVGSDRGLHHGGSPRKRPDYNLGNVPMLMISIERVVANGEDDDDSDPELVMNRIRSAQHFIQKLAHKFGLTALRHSTTTTLIVPDPCIYEDEHLQPTVAALMQVAAHASIWSHDLIVKTLSDSSNAANMHRQLAGSTVSSSESLTHNTSGSRTNLVGSQPPATINSHNNSNNNQMRTSRLSEARSDTSSSHKQLHGAAQPAHPPHHHHSPLHPPEAIHHTSPSLAAHASTAGSGLTSMESPTESRMNESFTTPNPIATQVPHATPAAAIPTRDPIIPSLQCALHIGKTIFGTIGDGNTLTQQHIATGHAVEYCTRLVTTAVEGEILMSPQFAKHLDKSYSLQERNSAADSRRYTTPITMFYSLEPSFDPLPSSELCNNDSNQIFDILDTEQEMLLFESWDFNVLRMQRKSLPYMLMYMFLCLDLVELFQLELNALQQFLVMVAQHYNDNYYHNFFHACDVTHSLYLLLKHLKSRGIFPLEPVEELALLISAICHDVGHTGQNNRFHALSHSPLALQYNYRSILEHYHLSLTYRLLIRPDTNFLSHLPPKIVDDIKSLISTTILATDMAFHGDYVKKFRANIAVLNEMFKPALSDSGSLEATSPALQLRQPPPPTGTAMASVVAEPTASAPPSSSPMQPPRVIDRMYKSADELPKSNGNDYSSSSNGANTVVAAGTAAVGQAQGEDNGNNSPSNTVRSTTHTVHVINILGAGSSSSATTTESDQSTPATRYRGDTEDRAANPLCMTHSAASLLDPEGIAQAQRHLISPKIMLRESYNRRKTLQSPHISPIIQGKFDSLIAAPQQNSVPLVQTRTNPSTSASATQQQPQQQQQQQPQQQQQHVHQDAASSSTTTSSGNEDPKAPGHNADSPLMESSLASGIPTPITTPQHQVKSGAENTQPAIVIITPQPEPTPAPAGDQAQVVRVQLPNPTRTSNPDSLNVNPAELVMTLMMKLCDISNICRPFPIARQWGELLQQEFFSQSDLEKKKHLQSLEGMDRDKTRNCFKGQFGFIANVGLPFIEIFLGEKPGEENLAVWRFLPEAARINMGHWKYLDDNDTDGK